MPISHLFLVLLVIVIWGLNFIFVKLGLAEMSPLLLCSIRFFLASIPAIFFIKPPAIPFKHVALYGIVMFAMQFGFVFCGMNVGMTPGMASLIMQMQVFFSIFFAVFFLGEQISPGQAGGALISFSGILLVAMHFDNNISILGFILILAASASWGAGNLITKRIKTPSLMALVIWGSFVACLPMFILSLLIEGPATIIASYHQITWKGIGSLLYIVYISTWVGYGIWGWVINRHPVGVIIPFTLLIPVVGILSSVLILGEPFQLWKLVAGLLVISGLCINILSTRFFMARTQPETA